MIYLIPNIIPFLCVLAGKALLIQVLYGILIIIALGGLLWAIDKWIYPVPPAVRAIAAVILVILLVIYFLP